MRIAAGLLMLLAVGSAHAAPSACAPGFDATTEVALYLGRDIENGGTVTDRMFADFVSRAIVPAFPDGFTLSDAHGEYRYRDGRIVVEQTKILTVTAQPDAALDGKIDRIVSAYKHDFRQEHVLEERRPICARLE